MLPRTQPYQTAGSGDTHAGLFEDIGTRSLQTVRIGEGAGKVSSGVGNAFVGYETGKQNTGGSFDTFIGYQAGANNTASSYSTMVGAFAGRQNLRGSEVVLIGYRAGELNRDGDRIVAIGPYAMRENYSGTGSVAVGFRALERTLDGDYNVVLGTEACQDLRSGNFNTAAGHQSGRAAFNSSENCYFGAFSGYSNQSGDGNCLVGFKSGQNLAEGSFNVGVGAYTLQNARDGSCNVAIGPFAGANMTTSDGSVIIGKNASAQSTRGNFNVVIGSDSGLSNDGNNNVLLGARVATNASVNSSVIIGVDAAPNLDGDASVVIGPAIAVSISQGSSNVLIGAGADGYREKVNSAIAIGTSNTYTSTNSISIGDDIVNERASSILLGYQLTSDANNSVIMGNDINIQSVIYWKDPLTAALTETVQADALTKLGISNIQYGNVLVNPDGQAYLNATVGIITSNTYNSVFTPKQGPISPASFDLRSIVSPCNYLIASGLSVPLRSNADTTKTIAMNTITSKIDTNTPLINLPSTSLLASTFIDRHSSNLIFSSSCNAIVNVLDINKNYVSVPIAFPKRAAFFHAPSSSSNVTFSQQVLTTASQTSAYALPQVFQSLDGISSIPNSTLKYAVIHPPTFGKLNKAVFQSDDVVLQYTPYKDATFAYQDSFTLRPVLEIVDSLSNIYGCPSSNDISVQVSISSPSSIYSAPELVSFDHAPVTLTSNALRSIPSQFPPTTPIRVSQIGSSVVLEVNGTQTLSNTDIQTMIAEEVHLYPDSAYQSNIDSLRIAACNITSIFTDTYVATFSNTIPAYIQDLIVTLSNITPTLSNIDSQIQGAQDVATKSVEVPNNLPTSFNTYKTAFQSWVTLYDNDYSLVDVIAASNSDFENNYLSALPFSYDQAVQQYATSLSNASTSNQIRDAVNTLLGFLNNNAPVTNLSTYPQVQSSLSNVNTILRKYFEVPRLFLTYDDVEKERIRFRISSSAMQDTAQIIIANTTVSYPINVYHTSTFWSTIPSSQTLSLTRSKQLTLQKIFTHPSATFYVENPPTHGALTISLSNVYYSLINPWISAPDKVTLVLANSLSNTADTQLTIQVTGVVYEPTLTIPCPPTTYAPSNTYQTLHSVEETMISLSNVIVLTSNTINFNNIVEQSISNIVTPIGTGEYDPLVGTLYATSNYTNSNVLKGVGDASLSNITSLFETKQFIVNYDGVESLNHITSLSNILVTPADTVASNIEIYDTWVITHSYTRQRDVHTSNIKFDQIHSFHFASNDASYFLYQEDGQLIERSPANVVTTSYQQIATRTTVSSFTSNITTHSNIRVLDPLYPLSRHVIYDGNPASVVTYTPNSFVDVVRSNTLPLTSFTIGSLDEGHMWLRLKGSNVMPTSLTFGVNDASVVSINCTLPPVSSVTSVSLSNVPVLLGNKYSVSNLGVWTLHDALPFTPTKIHVEDLRRGALHDGTKYTTTFDYASKASISYVASANDYAEDHITFYFSSNNSTFSPKFSRQLLLQRDPNASSQDVNTGLRYNSCNILSPDGFVVMRGSLNTQVNVTSLSNAFIEPSPSFTMQDVLNKIVRVSVLDPALEASFNYNVVDAEGVQTEHVFGFRPYRHISFPTPDEVASDSNVIRVESIGNAEGISNILTGPIWSYISDLKTPAFEVVPLSNVEMCFTTLPKDGLLWDRTQALRLPICMPLSQLRDHDIYYIPFNPLRIPNETVKVRLLYETTASPEYTLYIKNYVSRFPQIAYDPTVREAAGRQITLSNIIPRSDGLVEDGFRWYPDQPIDSTQQTQSPLLTKTITASLSTSPSTTPIVTTSLTVAPYAHSYPLNWNSTAALQAATDEADRWSLLPVLSRVTCNLLEERDIEFYVNTLPKHGILLNTATRSNVVRFSDTDIKAGHIIYQHLGINTSNDDFSLGLASTPYDLAAEELQMNIQIRPMPHVVSNLEMFVYHSNIASATSTIHGLASNLYTSGTGYMHVLQSNVDMEIPTTTSLSSIALNQTGFRFPQAYFAAHGSNAPFPLISFDLAVNNTDQQAYVNPLAREHDIYRPAFIIPFIANLNRHVSSNTVVAAQDREQVIAYDLNRSLPASSNLAGRIVTYFLQVRPETNVFDDTLINNPTQLSQTALLRTFSFQLTFLGQNDTLLFEVDFFKDVIEIKTAATSNRIPIPDQLQWGFGEWHNILFINEDLDNNKYASLYLDYDVTKSRVQNAVRNVLRNTQIEIPDLGVLEHIYLRTDMQSATNYVGTSSNFVHPSAVVQAESLNASFELQNARTKLQYRNQEIFITTYTIEESENGLISAAERQNHNVVIGKEITVRGTNNICVGNRFVTSGQNSIIVGNDIGSGSDIVDASTVNDVYESIIIGNESFQNSVVRDMISIGNRNMNNLYLSPVAKVNDFLSQRPIIIGNDINQDKLDFNINIGNTFVKTIQGGQQVYLGLNHELVGIGYTQNMSLSNAYRLHVNGNIFADGTITCSNLILTGQVTNVNVTQSNTDKLSIVNTGIGPALQVLQYGTQPSVQFFDNNSIAFTVANGGNVGIGTLSPTHRLHIVGDVNFTGSMYQNGALFVSGGTTSNASLLTEGTLSGDRLPNTGVVADVYGSSSSIPVLTVDAKGRITSASSVPLAEATNATNITSGTLSASRLPPSGVTAGPYGSSSTIPILSVDVYGRITAATSTLVNIPASSVTGLAPSASIDTTNATNISSGTLNVNLLPNSGVTANIYGTAASVPQITVDAKGRITSVIARNINIPSTFVTGLAASATIDTTNATNISTGILSVNRLPLSGVAASSYGSASVVPVIEVDDKGRITSVTNTSITLPSSSVTGLAPSATTDTTNASSIVSGTLSASVLPLTGVTASNYGTCNMIPQISVDASGRITSAFNVPIAVSIQDLTGLAPSATTDATNASNILTGTLSKDRLEASGVSAGTFGTSNLVPIVTVDEKGRVTQVATSNIQLDVSAVTGLAISATVDATNATNISTGTLSASLLPTTGVDPAEYGVSNAVAVFGVDDTGRITYACNVPILVSSNQVIGLASSATLDTTNATNISSGTLSATLLEPSGVTQGMYGSSNTAVKITVDSKGRLTNVTEQSIQVSTANVTGLAPSATIDVTNATNITSGTLTGALLETTGVSAGSYGSSNTVGYFTVDTKGRVTNASNIPIQLQSSAVLGLAPSATTDATNATNISSGTLDASRLPASGVVAGDYGSASTVPIISVDALGRLTHVALSNITISAFDITGLATSATTDTTNAVNIGSGTLDIGRFPLSGVVAQSYGSESVVPFIEVDQYGRVIQVASCNIAISASSVSGLAASATTDTTNATNISSGTLSSNLLEDAGVISGMYGNSNQVPVLHIDSKGRVVSATTSNIFIDASAVAGLAPSATSDTTNADNISTGTLSVDRLPATSVMSGTYGTCNTIPVLTLDTKGRITSVQTTEIGIHASNVSGLASSATTDVTNASHIISGTLDSLRLPSSGVVAGPYGASNATFVATVDATGRILSASNVPIMIDVGAVTGATNATNLTSGTIPSDRLPPTLVSQGTYGSSNQVAKFIVDATGRIQYASNVDIVISAFSVSGLAPSATIDTTNATNISTGMLSVDRLPPSGVSLGSYGSSNTVPSFFVDAKGRITGVSEAAIAIDVTSVSGLAPSATVDATNATNITSGTLSATQLSDAGVSSGLYGASNVIPQINVDAKGRVTYASNIPLTFDLTNISGLADVATTNDYASLSNVPFTMIHEDVLFAKSGNIGIGTYPPFYKLHVDGKIFASSSITAYSDQRVKTNIAQIPNSLELVKQLRGVSYDRIDTGEHEIGLIAQEVAQVLPEVVVDAPNGKSIAYGNMVAVLLEAIKTLSARVEDLEGTVKELRALSSR